MSTSGSTDFSLTFDEIVAHAALETGDIALGETVPGDVAEKYGQRLNSWVKQLCASGTRLWALEEATLFLSPGTAQYALGLDGTHCTTSYVQTELSSDAAAAATTLVIDATTGMADGDNIGVVLDDGTLHWTTIDGAPGASVSLADALPSAASAGAAVYAYTTKITRPQRIDEEMTYWRSSAGMDTPVRMSSRAEYKQQANKASRGKVVQAYYDRQRDTGQLYLWPAPDSANDVLRFSYERLLEDFDEGTDTPDFLPEWTEALILGLAHRMSTTAGMALPDRVDLERRANAALAIAMDFDRENVSTFLQPEMQ